LPRRAGGLGRARLLAIEPLGAQAEGGRRGSGGPGGGGWDQDPGSTRRREGSPGPCASAVAAEKGTAPTPPVHTKETSHGRIAGSSALGLSSANPVAWGSKPSALPQPAARTRQAIADPDAGSRCRPGSPPCDGQFQWRCADQPRGKADSPPQQQAIGRWLKAFGDTKTATSHNLRHAGVLPLLGGGQGFGPARS
jgi:hypothetical protein